MKIISPTVTLDYEAPVKSLKSIKDHKRAAKDTKWTFKHISKKLESQLGYIYPVCRRKPG